MSKPNKASRGKELASRLQKATIRLQRAPIKGARELPRLVGLTPQGTTLLKLDNVLEQASEILRESGRVYRYGDGVYLSVGEGPEGKLVPLLIGRDATRSAAACMANLFVCETPPNENGESKQFAPPAKLAQELLCREPTLDKLPEIKLYARRPVFDSNFKLCQPGWHPGSGILVHGIEVEAPERERVTQQTDSRNDGGADELQNALQRLPPRLYGLLRDFCFRSPADVANTLAALLTGLLMNHHIETGHPIILLDGNQPGVGKTLLARVMAIVLDGIDPRVIHFSHDEELQKRIVATLRGSQQSTLIIDNVKTHAGTPLNSPVLEANCLAPEIALRILGESTNYTRPNDVSWVITMNNTKSEGDLVDRNLPIRFYHEGSPRGRKFDQRNPLQYAHQHRREILGELAGMVYHWNKIGRPLGTRPHRLTKWSQQVGGILEANGFPEVLENLDEAAAEFDTQLDELAALAEAVIGSGAKHLYAETSAEPAGGHTLGATPADWGPIFDKAKVATEKLDKANVRTKGKTISNVFARYLNQSVTIEVGDRVGKATLCREEGRSRKKLYFFRVTWEDGEADDAVSMPVPPAEVEAKEASGRIAEEGGNTEAW